MKFYSTKKTSPKVSFSEAARLGVAADGGLFLPESLPRLHATFFDRLDRLTLHEIAFEVLKPFVSGCIDDAKFQDLVKDAFSFPVPVVSISDSISSLELFHGPTLAFKDFGARFMAAVMAATIRQPQTILVATSGDTGSAVAAAFHKRPGFRIVVLYPSGKVSSIQEKQLTTLGDNVTALEVMGTFDDCHHMVRQAFFDPDLKDLGLTSANSINVARLLPQCLYYFTAFPKVKDNGSGVVFCVPSGNFGNLTGGLFAKAMGLNIKHFIAATNINDAVPRYLASGKFDPQPSRETISNAMDVGHPSNFARIVTLYPELASMRRELFGICIDDKRTEQAIIETERQHHYVLDPHGAVAYAAIEEYRAATGDKANCILLETAHPAKFPETMEALVPGKTIIPDSVRELAGKPKLAQTMQSSYADFKAFLRAGS